MWGDNQNQSTLVLLVVVKTETESIWIQWLISALNPRTQYLMPKLLIWWQNFSAVFKHLQLTVVGLITPPDLMGPFVVLCQSKVQGQGCRSLDSPRSGPWWLWSMSPSPYWRFKHIVRRKSALTGRISKLYNGANPTTAVNFPLFVDSRMSLTQHMYQLNGCWSSLLCARRYFVPCTIAGEI